MTEIIAPPVRTVRPYTRHNPNCPKVDDRNYEKCDCPKWLYVYENSKSRLMSAKTRSWKKAKEFAQQIEDSWDPLKVELATLKRKEVLKQVAIEFAIDSYIKHLTASDKAPGTISIDKLILGRMKEYASARGLVLLSELTTPVLSDWWVTWTEAPSTKNSRRDRIVAFFNYCGPIKMGWIKHNPAAGKRMTRLPDEGRQTLPFTQTQFAALLRACHKLPGTCFYNEPSRVHAMLQLLRFSGLRISDASRVPRTRLHGDQLFLRKTKKTGVPIYCSLPPSVSEQLRMLKSPDGFHFFWDGKRHSTVDATRWGQVLNDVAELAEADNPKLFRSETGERERIHLHRLRDTFAVELLIGGASLEQVALLLGHTSIRTTEKHYAPFVKARQKMLDEAVQKGWGSAGVQIAQAASVIQ